MTASKLREAVETGATKIVTADAGCLLQMRGLADEATKIEHLAIIIAAALD